MNNVRIADGKGREITVSEKAFELIYQHKGFTLVGPADEASAPAAKTVADDEVSATQKGAKTVAKAASKAPAKTKASKKKVKPPKVTAANKTASAEEIPPAES